MAGCNGHGKLLAGRGRPTPLPQRNPVAVADRFAADLHEPGVTQALVAKRHGVRTATVSYHLALLRRLPANFVDWLRAVDDVATLSLLTERRLRPLTRIKDPQTQRTHLNALLKTIAR